MAIKFTCKQDKDSESRNVEIDFPGSRAELLEAGWNDDDIFAHAMAAIIVKAQGMFRKIGTTNKKGDTYKTPKNWTEALKIEARLTHVEKVQKSALEQTDVAKIELIKALQKSMK